MFSYIQPTAVAAGTGCMEGQTAPEPFFVRRSIRARRADFIVRVSGRSMEPKYYDVDYLYVKSAESADDGDDVICVYHEGFVVKRLKNRKLYSLNENYPFGDHYEDDNIRIEGIVLGVVEPDDPPTPDDIPILRKLFSKEIREFEEKYETI